MSKKINYNFSKNLYKALILPITIIILAVLMFFFVGFNKGIELKGGIIASVNVGIENDLSNKKTYSDIKKQVDDIIEENDSVGKIYTIEINDLEENVLVVKMEYKGKSREKSISDIKTQLIQKFYSTTSLEDIENKNLIEVSVFGSSLNKIDLLKTTLATFIALVLMAAYVIIRQGLNAGVNAFVSSGLNIITAVALMIILRIKVDTLSMLVVPFTAVISMFSAFVYRNKIKNMLNYSDKYEKLSNETLANDALEKTAKIYLIMQISFSVAFILTAISSLIVGGISSSLAWLMLAFILSLAIINYNNFMCLPGVFARTYTRKVKKTKIKKEVKTEKLDEAEVLKETDLDNLVSN